MNDRFRFRVWHKPLKTMHYNDFIVTATGYMAKIYQQDDYMMKFNQEDLEFDKQCILMQSTGLKDKNGKLIYEGDIISCQGKAVIAYSDDKALFYAHYFNTVGICEWYLFELKKIFAQCEVIGNIYENKELLEDTECQK